MLPAPATNWGTPFGGAPGGPGSDLGPDSARFVSKKVRAEEAGRGRGTWGMQGGHC